MLKVVAVHRDHRITKSGKMFKIFKPEGGNLVYQRFSSVDAAKCCIDAAIEQRPYTDAEYTLVFGSLSTC